MEYSGSSHGTRGFPVEFAALGFLIEEPLHGYALRSRIHEGLGPLWQIASSQLYQVLHKLEERGWVLPSSESDSAGPSKTVYRVTQEGSHAFWEWAHEPVQTMRTVRVEFAAKIYFLRRLRSEEVCQLIDRQLGALEDMEQRIISEEKKGSDDAALNAMWLTFQTTTIGNFYRWLAFHRTQLCSPKENDE